MIIVQLSGGIGNQMFQYAFAKALALKYKTKLVMDVREFSVSDPSITPRKFSLDAFRLKSTLFEDIQEEQLPDDFTLVEDISPLYYDENIIHRVTKNSYLCGIWQSWRYFQHIETVIRKNFRFTLLDFKRQNLFLADVIRNSQSVSIHIRRTDYLHPRWAMNGALPKSYYDQAIQYISRWVSHPVFYVFLDDPDWAESNIITPHETHIIRGNSDAEDLFLMTQCKHNIIANSTFSWWGAWLNTSQRKINLAPSKWFLGLDTRLSQPDILLPDWIKIQIDGKM